MTPTATARPAAGRPRPYHFPAFERRRLGSGVELITAPVRKLPLVSIVALLDAGATRDPAGREGLAILTAKLLLEGTMERDGATLVDAFEQLGATVDISADWDGASVQLSVLRDHAAAALGLLSEVLQAPGFRERDVARLKAERRAARLQMRTEPRELADESFEHYLYAPASRYSSSDAGSSRSIAAVHRDDVVRFYQGQYVPARATLIMVGDIGHDEAATMAERAFSGWTGVPGPTTAISEEVASRTRQVRIVAKSDAPQSELRIGHLGVPRTHPHYFKLVVMNAVLGGLFSSRINLNLRERHGYAYGAHSAFEWRRGAGPFVVSTAVESGVSADATREVVSEIEAFQQAPITSEELSLATSFLSGVFPIRFETTMAVATALANMITYGYPADYFDRYRDNISAISTEDVLEAARVHLHPDQLLVLAVGDPDVVQEPLERLELGPINVTAPEDVEPGE
ncbi:MAG TPA: pitrilysin family protein [Gemmatimonadaceae bacterium]